MKLEAKVGVTLEDADPDLVQAAHDANELKAALNQLEEEMDV
jgi:hypothetical protein